jgi:hypothetical protein
MSDKQKPAPLAYRTSDVQHPPTRPTVNQSLGTALLTVVLLIGGGLVVLVTLLAGCVAAMFGGLRL